MSRLNLRALIIGPFRAGKKPIPEVEKNQEEANSLVGGFGYDELVLYGLIKLV